jgi:hypothetical protein
LTVEPAVRAYHGAVTDAPSRRRHDITRLEAFTDAAFGFALTLLVVSLEVPTTFADLIAVMKGSIAFAMTFAMIVWIWREHNDVFRTYGLDDGITVVLNSMLIFLVLIYMYPLKFMVTVMVAVFFGIMPAGTANFGMSMRDLPMLFIVYGVGFIGLFSVFGALHFHAYRRRDRLGLSPDEVFSARARAVGQLLNASVGVGSVLLALFAPAQYAPVAGWFYSLLGPLNWLYWARVKKHHVRLTA